MALINGRLTTFGHWLRSSVPHRPVLAGAVVTAAAMYVLFLVPNAIAFRVVRSTLNNGMNLYLWDNPLSMLPYLGGIGGGYVAGYLSRDTWSSWFRNGILAIVFGVGIYYMVSNFWSVLRFFVVGELTISILMVIYIRSFIFMAAPFGLLYSFEAIVSSLVGYLTAKTVASHFSIEPKTDESRRMIASPAVILRWVTASGVLAALFISTWLFLFYTQSRL